MLSHVRQEGVCACVMTLGFFFFFFCTEVQSLVAHVLAVQPVNSSERTKIQQFVAEVDLGGKVDGKRSQTEITHTLLHTYTHTEKK